MYTIPAIVETSLRTNASLREYARNEYGRNSVDWFLAATRRAAPKAPRRSLTLRLRFQRAPHTHRLVGHKGTPRLAPSDLQPAT